MDKSNYFDERIELQKILKDCIETDTLMFQLGYTDEFYKELFRLWETPFNVENIKQRPNFIRKVTLYYLYDKKVKDMFFDKVTTIDEENLKKRIYELTTLISVSQNKEEFNRFFEYKYNAMPIQLEFMENIEKQKSSFNRYIERALNYNPNCD